MKKIHDSVAIGRVQKYLSIFCTTKMLLVSFSSAGCVKRAALPLPQVPLSDQYRGAGKIKTSQGCAMLTVPSENYSGHSNVSPQYIVNWCTDISNQGL